jgi:hypothetical protein
MSADTIHTPDTAAQPAQDEQVYEDYWGVQETFQFVLPDGKQYFTVKPMDEGMKTRFQKLTNKGIRMNQRSQEAHLDIDPADERHTLILESVVDWRIMQKDADGSWTELPCPTDDGRRKKSIRDNFLEKFNPKIIQELEFFIRTKNPWMQADMDLEELYKQRDEIDLLIKQKKEADAGEDDSTSK